MSKYHLSGHLDKHSLTHRYLCREKIAKGVNCNKSYKQKLALIRHLFAKHHKSSLEAGRVVIREEEDVVYETVGDYNYVAESQLEKADMINDLVETYGEEIYELGEKLNVMFGRVRKGSKMFGVRDF